MENTTYLPKKPEAQWFLIDAQGQRLGRLAVRIAMILRGKDKPTYTPHMDTGDFVVVINADKLVVTGRKRTQKVYRRHSGRPGGMKVETFAKLIDRLPARVLEHAVKGMLPKGRLGRHLFTKLKVYAGESHPHEAQQPQVLKIQTIPGGN